MSYSKEELQKALDKAKIELMSRPDSVFFTTVCFSLKHIWDESIGTAGTNGKTILFSPTFFMKQTPGARVGLMLHETLHVAYQHMLRLKERNPQRWNIAADHVINLQLLERGFELPPNGCADPQYKGLSTEQVYDLLPDDPPPMEMDLLEPEGNIEQLHEEIQEIIVRAAVQAKMAGDTPGSIPGDIQIMLDKLLNPKLPWQQILRKFLRSMDKNDYSFRRPNRRFFPAHHLPSLWSESLMDIDIAVDTSGSVSDAEFNRFVSETEGILRMMKPRQIRIVQFDVCIKSVETVRNVRELLNVTFTGRGGTRIEPVLQWAEDNHSKCLLVFTDGGFNFYRGESPNTIVWLIHDNETFEAPFGKVIHYQMEG